MTDSLGQALSAISSKIERIDANVTHLLTKSTQTLWAPIIAALITAVVGSIAAQAIERRLSANKEKEKDLREIHSLAVNLKIKLKDLFRQLAMYKFHAQYWWHLHSTEPNHALSDKYYAEHLRSQAEARDTEKEIGVTKADFLAQIVKFEKIKGKRFNVDNEKKAIENIVFEKAKTYSELLSQDDLREKLAEPDEKALREKYFENLAIFQTVIDRMV